MTLQERLDADMKAQLRSRYRPLPSLLPATMGEPVESLDDMPATIEREIANVLVRSGVHAIECKAQTAASIRKPHLTMRQLLEVVADHSGEKLADLTSARRARHLARPRQVVMWLARKHTPYSLPHVGRSIGNRDHTTVMHACRVIDKLLAEKQPDITLLVENSERTIEELSKQFIG